MTKVVTAGGLRISLPNEINQMIKQTTTAVSGGGKRLNMTG